MLEKVTTSGTVEPHRLAEELAAARERLAMFSADRDLGRRQREARASGLVIDLDYPVHPRARDFSLSPHMQRLVARLDASAGLFRERLVAIANRSGEQLRAISVAAPADPRQPHWGNDWLPGLDGACLYSFLVERNPATFLEVGSGNSTKFARRAISDYGLRTRIVSIDPQPRAEVDEICDEMHRTGFESFDLERLSQLEAGDVVFIDNSHRALPNSDVTVMFMEMLGRLPKGCLYGLHDIFLPFDYPEEWARTRFYSEQYMLAAYLFGGGDGDEIHLPARYCASVPEIISALDGLWKLDVAVSPDGGAFWMTKG